MSTVYTLFSRSAAQFAANDFLHIPLQACRDYADTAITVSYQQALDAVEAQAAQYQSLGYGIGHRVALCLANRPEFFTHWFALNKLGASVVPVNGEMQPDEINYLLEHSESCLVITLAEKHALISEACAAIDKAPAIVESTALNTIPAAGAPANAQPDSDTECALLYTSGSTGKPKGCILSNEYFLEFGEWYRTVDGHCALSEGVERLITPLPLVHMNAMAVSSMGMIASGGCIVQLDRFHPSSWWQSVRDSKATAIHYLGVMPAILLGFDEQPEDDFSGQIKFAFGAGVNPKHHAAFEKRFGFPLIEAWAMSESGVGGSIIANNEPRHVGTCCFGKAKPRVEYRIVDEEHNDVAAGEPGELLVRAAGDNPRKAFFSGYLKNPEATAEAWLGGYLNTGDVVAENPDGTLVFVDRRKNVIRRSGENISALEVEAALSEDPAIALAIASAVPDDIRGDEVMALVILEEGQQASQALADEIVQRALQSLVYYKVPGYVAFRDSLPMTASQKPKRGDIKTLGRELLAQKDCFDTRALKKRA